MHLILNCRFINRNPPLKALFFERNEESLLPDMAKLLDAWKWAEGSFSVKNESPGQTGSPTMVTGEVRVKEVSMIPFDIMSQKKAQLLANRLQPPQRQ